MFFDGLTFWIALAVGFFIAYIFIPKPTVVYKYPTPENAGKITYVDNTGVCYKYKATQIACPSNDATVKPIVRE